MVAIQRHSNKGSKSRHFAEGGMVKKDDEEEGSMSGMVPKALHKLWGVIPSAADVAVTGKLSATPEEYDKARTKKDAEIDRRKKKAK